MSKSINITCEELFGLNEALEKKIKDLEEKVSHLEAGNTQLHALLDNIPFYTWLKDENGRYIIINKPFADHYHSSKDAIVGKTDFDICMPEFAQKYDLADKEVIRLKKRKLIQ